MNRTNKAIEDLCTSYHAYMNAIGSQNNTAIVVWAKCLLDDQQETGVELVPQYRLRDTIALRQNILAETY